LPRPTSFPYRKIAQKIVVSEKGKKVA